MATSDLNIPFTTPGLHGGVTIAHQVIVTLAGTAARGTYGVVAMQDSSLRKLSHLFRGNIAEGVEVEIADGKVNVGLHVVMERGVNLAQVTANVEEQVRYQLGEVGGLPLGDVSVRVEDLQD